MGDLAQLVFSVPDEVAEAVANLLSEEVGAGLEQRDSETLDKPEQAGNTELVVCVPSSRVEAQINAVNALLASLAEMGQRTDPHSHRSQDIRPEDWIDLYKRHFKAHRLARHTVVKPSWEDYEAAAGELVVELDPGQAFGTGLHASTRLCVSALERSARLGPAPSDALDVGCGTGILAIVIARLWPSCRVLAVDNDPIAVEVARENVARNGLSDRIKVEQRSAADLDGQYGIVTANLTFEALVELAPVLRERIGDFGRLIMSGLLSERARELQQVYTHDLILESEYTEEQDGWRSVTVRVRA
ncbi:MAG: 50S ribosomal protein L11 methyltransferase [Myxococcales bacterium]|nr:50S ribosomal protein L11 methyltransferase [Myxococcales bacterium]